MLDRNEFYELRRQGKYTCGKCLRVCCEKRLMYRPEDPEEKAGLCRACWTVRNERVQEIVDGPVVGNVMNTPFAEDFWLEHSSASYPEPRHMRSVGFRTDARWYKKAGGNGDG